MPVSPFLVTFNISFVKSKGLLHVEIMNSSLGFSDLFLRVTKVAKELKSFPLFCF